MRMCKICERGFCRPYSLRRHYSQFHPAEDPPKLERMPRNKIEDQMNQQGAGDIFSDHSDSESGMEDDEEDGDRSDSESAMEDDDEDDDPSDSESAMKDDDEDESKVFRYLVRQAKNELKKDGIHEVSHELLQEKFRELLIYFLHWKDRLCKIPFTKKSYV